MVGANHLTKYKRDAARRHRVEGLLRAPEGATGCHHTAHIYDHRAQLIRFRY